MFTSTGLIHLAILTHHHHNIYKNIDSNNNDNTVSATHAQKSLFLLSTPTEVALYATILYPTLQVIYTILKATLSNKFLYLEEGLQRSFPPLLLGSPCLPPISLDSHQSQIKQDEILGG